jgi:MinD-like ATPase involved in chromosome partitioning or flagellar assembly
MPDEGYHGKVITFYSYKGGTGRTMALANVACLLARNQFLKKGILMIDWDLEAPGLHRFFYPSGTQQQIHDAFEQLPGLIDFFWECDKSFGIPRNNENIRLEDVYKELIEKINISNYIQPTDISKIYLLKAGRFDGEYPKRVNTFRWDYFYEKLPDFFRILAETLATSFDYILIDSRTGITDTSGICTMIMPERLVVVFVPNQQSLTGVSDLVKRAVEYRKSSDDLRPLVIFPLPSRIEANQPDLREKWRKGDDDENITGYQRAFERLLANVYNLEKCDLEDYFDNVQIQHIPYYAYGEKIAVQLERSEDSLSIAKSYVSFTERLADSVSPWDYPGENIQLNINPFIYGRPLSPAEFTGRQVELNRIASRLSTGQSIAVVGQPHIGKTSLLTFLADAPARRKQFGEEFGKNYFVFLDVLATQGIRMQADFWKYALAPLRVSEFSAQYDYAAQEGYNNFALEQVFDNLERGGRKFILMLDEFDSLLSHPVLNKPDFYGGLRSLASRSGGLALVIATRRSLEQLNQLTQELNPHGSPYFNVFVETQLGALKPEGLTALLDKAGDHITNTDRLYIERVSGRHPYLAQAAAAMLWDVDQDGLTNRERYKVAGQNLHREVRQHFSDTWNSWSNTTRRAVTAVGLAEILHLLSEPSFKLSELVEDLDDYGEELDILQVSGTFAQSDEGEWSVAQDALLWWLADELRRNIREEVPFGDWIRAQHMDNLLTERDRQRLTQAAQSVLSLVGKGATTLIETLAKGFGESVLK